MRTEYHNYRVAALLLRIDLIQLQRFIWKYNTLFPGIEIKKNYKIFYLNKISYTKKLIYNLKSKYFYHQVILNMEIYSIILIKIIKI